jgi:hypothetical protein
MCRCAALLLVVAVASPAVAEPARAEPAWNVSVRVAASYGTLEENSWAYPEVDIVGTYALGARGFVELAGGYTPVDNHTYLSDGRAYRVAIAGGAKVVAGIRAAAALGLESVTFHADADVLAEHPDVDIVASRGRVLPSANLELAYPVRPSTSVGVFTRVALRELTLYDTPAGDRERARLVLFGAFLQFQLR